MPLRCVRSQVNRARFQLATSAFGERRSVPTELPVHRRGEERRTPVIGLEGRGSTAELDPHDTAFSRRQRTSLRPGIEAKPGLPGDGFRDRSATNRPPLRNADPGRIELPTRSLGRSRSDPLSYGSVPFRLGRSQSCVRGLRRPVPHPPGHGGNVLMY